METEETIFSTDLEQLLDEDVPIIANVKVYLRLAPMDRATDCERCVSLVSSATAIELDQLPIVKRVQILNPLSTYEDAKEFSFEQVFTDNVSMEEVYFPLKEDVLSVLKGWNTSIIAYGPTNTGKTYSMCGSKHSLGIIALSLRDIFTESRAVDSSSVQIKLSVLELYNNRFRSLINSSTHCIASNLSLEIQAGEGSSTFVTPTRVQRSKSSPMPFRSENLSNISSRPSFMRSASSTRSSSTSIIKCQCIACDMFSTNCNKVSIQSPEEGIEIVCKSFEARTKVSGSGQRHSGSSRYSNNIIDYNSNLVNNILHLQRSCFLYRLCRGQYLFVDRQGFIRGLGRRRSNYNL